MYIWNGRYRKKALLPARVISSLNIQPQERQTLSLDYQITDNGKETFLNLFYKLKDSESLLEAGHIVARQQLDITAYNWNVGSSITTENQPEIYDTRYALEVSTTLRPDPFQQKERTIKRIFL